MLQINSEQDIQLPQDFILFSNFKSSISMTCKFIFKWQEASLFQSTLHVLTVFIQTSLP
jgi:hypothetical protein